MGGVLSVAVGLVTSLQTSGRRYSVCILDTFKIGLILYILQLSLPDSVTKRYTHSLSAIQLSPHSVLLVVFGGWRSPCSARLSHTALIELSEHYQMYCPCSTAAIVTDTGQWYRCTADITVPLSHAVLQEDGGQWVVGRILEGAALEDKRVYQQILPKRSITE